jgi:hypothetical protein
MSETNAQMQSIKFDKKQVSEFSKPCIIWANEYFKNQQQKQTWRSQHGG